MGKQSEISYMLIGSKDAGRDILGSAPSHRRKSLKGLGESAQN
jgi:hypothetical protein